MTPNFRAKLIETLGLDHLDVDTITLTLGARKKSAVVKIALTEEQIQALDNLVEPIPDAEPTQDPQDEPFDPYHRHQIDRLNDDGNTLGLN